jgi:glycosyltransferase involved in cell wall biosynthesis
LKIAIVTETFPPEVNGVAMTFGVIARELGRRGHRVIVHHPRRDDLPPAVPSPDYAEVTHAGFPIPGYRQIRLGFPAGRRLRRAWEAERPDLVHVVTEGPLGASAVSTARAAGIPVTSSFHTNFHTYARHYGIGPLRRSVLAWLRRVHNRTLRTFAPTEELCAELAESGFLNLRLLSRGVDTWGFHPARRSPVLRQQWGAGPDDPVVLHVGRMAPEKDYGLLFEAYAAMRRANPRLRVVLAGEGPLRARLMREHPECVFAGFLPRDEIGRYYASADLYVHASRSETFGNVLTEALASGLAVAGFDYAAARQFIRHGESGLLARFDSPAELVEAATLLSTDDFLRAKLRLRAREAVEEHSWETVVALFEADLLAVVGGEGAPVSA